MGQIKPQVCRKQPVMLAALEMKSMRVSKQKRSPIAEDIPDPIPSHFMLCRPQNGVIPDRKSELCKTRTQLPESQMRNAWIRYTT